MTLAEWYARNADATGHAADCARRETDMTKHRGLDATCPRCQVLRGKLDDAAMGWKVAR